MFMRPSEASPSMVPGTSCSGERCHLCFPGDTLKQWYLFSFWLWVLEGLYLFRVRNAPAGWGYWEFWFPASLGTGVLGEATREGLVWASSGHTGSLQGTGLPDPLSLCTFCTLEFGQNPELSVALWRSTLTPPGMDVSIQFEPYCLLPHRLVAAGLLVPSRLVLGSYGENMGTSHFGCTVCVVPALSWRGLVCSFRSNLTRGFWDSWAHQL